MHPLIRNIKEKKYKRNINIDLAILPSYNMCGGENQRKEPKGRKE